MFQKPGRESNDREDGVYSGLCGCLENRVAVAQIGVWCQNRNRGQVHREPGVLLNVVRVIGRLEMENGMPQLPRGLEKAGQEK